MKGKKFKRSIKGKMKDKKVQRSTASTPALPPVSETAEEGSLSTPASPHVSVSMPSDTLTLLSVSTGPAESVSTINAGVSSKVPGKKRKVVDPWNASPFMVAMQERRNKRRMMSPITDGNESELSDLSLSDCDDDTYMLEKRMSDSDSQSTSNSENASVNDDIPIKKNVRPLRWKLRDKFEPNLVTLQQHDDTTDKRVDWNPSDYFQEYFDQDLFEKFSRATNVNCTLLTGKSLDTTPAEMMTFFGMNLMMSCLRYPSVRMYWKKSLRVPRLSEAMGCTGEISNAL